RHGSAVTADPSLSSLPHRPSHPSSAAGTWYLAGLGLALAAVGAVFVWLMWRSYERAREMRAWPEVECVILSSQIEEQQFEPNSSLEYRLNVLFAYGWQGQSLTSDRISLRGSSWTSKPGVIATRA